MAKRMAAPDLTPEPTASSAGRISLADLGVASDSAGVEKPRLQRSPRFLFFVHPERWMVLEGQVVPALKRQVLQNGVNGITQDSIENGGRYRIGKLLELQRKKGWTLLDPMIDGEQAYLYEVSEGVWLTRWETAHAGSSVVSSDVKGYVGWLAKLVADGKIEAPRAYVLSAMLATLKSEAARLQDQVRTVPSTQVYLDDKLAAIKVVEAALNRLPLTPLEKNTRTNPLAGSVTSED